MREHGRNILSLKLNKELTDDMVRVKTKVELKDGEFYVWGKKVQRSNTALICKCTNKNRIRQAMVWITSAPFFEWVIFMCIIVNSIFMAVYDYKEFHKCAYANGGTCKQAHMTSFNHVIDWAGYIFGIVFMVESAVKIIAFGAFSGKKAYFTEGWNVLDFSIVVVGIVEFILEQVDVQGINLRALRVLRILRPLKAVNQLPSLRKQVRTLVKSLRGLVSVMIFLLTIFSIFSIVGLQWFAGVTHYACRVGAVPPLGSKTWPKLPSIPGSQNYEGVCTPNKNQYFSDSVVQYSKCPADFDIDSTCGSPTDFHLSFEDDGIHLNEAIQYGIGSFDNFGQSSLAVFQIITLDNWSNIMYNLASQQICPIFAELFCIVLVFMGSFFLLNLMLAVVMESYIQSEVDETKKMQIQLDNEKLELQQRLNLVKKVSYAEKRQTEDIEEEKEEQAQEKDASHITPSEKSSGPQRDTDMTVMTLHNPDENEETPIEQNFALQTDEQDDGALTISTTISKNVISSQKQRDIGDKRCVELKNFQREVEDLNDEHIAKYLMNTMHKNVETALESEQVQHRDDAQKIIGLEKRMLGLRYESALVTKYKTEEGVDHPTYGLQDEGESLQQMRKQIENSLQKQKTTSPDNPIAVSSQFVEIMKHKGKPSMEKQRRMTQAFGSHSTLFEGQFLQIVKQKEEDEKKKVLQEDNKTLDEYENEKVEIDKIAADVQQRMKIDLETKIQKKETTKTEMQMQPALDLADRGIDILQQDMIEMRAERNKLYRTCLNLTKTKSFTCFISTCIIVNTIVLAFDRYPSDPVLEEAIEFANLVFYFIFVAEMTTKLIAFGFVYYMREKANVFDFCLVVFTTIDLIAMNFIFVQEENPAREENHKSNLASVFRVFRLLRVFKLASYWHSFNYFLLTIQNTLTKIGSFIALLLFFIFIYAILGLEFFSNKIRFDYDNQPIPYFAPTNANVSRVRSVPPSNFDTFAFSFISVFIVLANDGWTTVFFDQYRSHNTFISTMFFISLVLLGQMILYNLFLAILLKEFDERSMILDAQENKKEVKVPMYKRCWKALRVKSSKIAPEKRRIEDQADASVPSKQNSQQGVTETDSNEEEEEKDEALYLMSQENCCRKRVKSIVQSKYFDSFIIVIILISSVSLAAESPLNDPKGTLVYILFILELMTTVIFIFEMIVKIISGGFLCNGPDSYLQNSWNIVDFTIVAVSIMSLFPLKINLTTLKIIRMVRLLRPLRVISKNQSLRLSIQALIISVPAVVSLMVIVFLIMLIFAIVGVSLMKGMAFYCDWDSVIGMSEFQKEELVKTHYDCMNYGGMWRKVQYNFDNIQRSLIQILVMSQTVNWSKIMFHFVDSKGPNLMPGHWENKFLSLFFISFVIIGSFFINNLFVGVVISAYNKEVERLGKGFLLTDKQKNIISTKILLLNVKPKIATNRPENGFRQLCFDISVHRYFEVFILTSIALNSVQLTIHWPDMTADTEGILKNLNVVFTVIFSSEAVIKIIAFKRLYFKDSWNLFDFLVVMANGGLFLIQFFTTVHFATAALIIRSLRIGRLYKLFRNLPTLQIIFQTFLNTMHSLNNVGLLMFVILYIYAIVGMALFSTVKIQEPLHGRLNFQSLSSALITLMLIATGDSWNDIMDGLGLVEDCIENPTYEDYIAAGKQTVGCGNYPITCLYFFTFVILISLIFLNLFMAIIMNGYFDTRDRQVQALNEEMLGLFKTAWSAFDPEASGFIEVGYFTDFMFMLGVPLGWDKAYRNDLVRQEESFKTISGGIKDYDEKTKLHFCIVLDNIACQYVIRQEIKKALRVKEIQQEEKNSSGKKNLMIWSLKKHLNKKLMTTEEDLYIKSMKEVEQVSNMVEVEQVRQLKKLQGQKSQIKTKKNLSSVKGLSNLSEDGVFEEESNKKPDIDQPFFNVAFNMKKRKTIA